ncbi:hypothetical protein [Nocardioides sp. zg-DK7169]|uniref:hypothetical protein n=1 Tax=Nocardioides sp. zg-DK7169 TaxID=2736600 RepID=UPI0015576314|nr:hypothetical protein [Nocardioides sp. zg-DK7169]NPC97653.1 hypothetical protein [Nocardioides sp. zg-DK7169]
MSIVELDSPDLAWGQHTVAGADVPAGMVMLHADAQRPYRAVLVGFPDGWRRDVTGNQPAGEEMVVVSGALHISGRTCAVGEVLLAEPHATRAATSTEPGTRAVVWFTGTPGGWSEGEAEHPGNLDVVPIAPGVLRGPSDTLPGTVEVREDVSGAVFDSDVDLVWPDAQRYLHLPAGTPAPQVAGPAVVRVWG